MIFLKDYEYLSCINFNIVKNKIPKRPSNANKGDFGRLLCVCGSKNMPGSAYFCTASAVRCGVGICELFSVDKVCESVAAKIPEPMYHHAEQNYSGSISCGNIENIIKCAQKSGAVLIGPGMGWNEDTKNIIFKVISEVCVPIIVDADGINVLSENIDILKKSKSCIVLTPHIKEMSRLINKSVEYVLVNKNFCVKELSKKYNVVTVLKDHKTIISDVNGNLYLNTTGNSGMAKGGSGDVLSGMIGSFLAQGYSAIDATICAVYIHGMSGDECSQKFSDIAMTPSDLINNLPSVFLKFK